MIDEIVQRAVAARAHLAHLDAVRMVDGAADGAGTVVVERFGDAYRVTGPPDRVADLAEIRRGLGDPPRLYWRFGHADEGGPDAGELEVEEDGLRYGVRLLGGKNSGLFLDGRPARRWVRENADGRRVLNLFAFTCGFGVAAAAGGARATTNVDPVPGVLARGRANYERNGLPFDGRTFWRADALSALRRAGDQGARYDGVVLDPPPFPTGGRRGRRIDPVRHLPRLCAACRDVLEPGGWLLLLSGVRDLSDAALIEAVALGEPVWRGTSGDDFRALEGSARLRAWAFVQGEPVQPPR